MNQKKRIKQLAFTAGILCLLGASGASAKVRSNTQERLPDNVYKADVDGDGSLDFIELNGSKIVVRRSDFAQTVILTDTLALGNKITQIFTGDFTPPGRREHGKDQICGVFADGSLSCWAISDDKKAMWWWFTQGSIVGAGEHAIVGEFTGDGVDDVMVYRPSNGDIRLYKPGSVGAFFDPVTFSLGNLTGINRANKQIRVGEFGQALGRSDLLVFDPATRQVLRFDTVTNASGQPEFWWAFTTVGNTWSTSEDFTVANVAATAQDDVVFRNRSTGAYRFFKAQYSGGLLAPITNVQTGQLPTSAGGTVLFGKAANFAENGGSLRDDALYFTNGTLVRTDARWSGSAFTYWWAYTRSAPKYTRSQRTLYDLSAAQRQQLSNLMRTYITEDLIAEHAGAHDWHHPTSESFFYQHRGYITRAEKFLLDQGGSLFVPMPMWDPNTAVPAELQWVKAFANGTARTPLQNVNPHQAMPSSLASPAICSFTTASALVQAVNNWHGNVHIVTGGNPGTTGFGDVGNAPAAVIFFPWHAFVDNIYARWQDCR